MKHESIEQWFSRNARAFPHHIAISSPQRQLTYADLSAAATQLSESLRSLDLPPQTTVAILSDDVTHVITSILGILQAGCAFVPLDPHLPENRLSTMLSIVKPQYFIADSHYAPLIKRITAQATAPVKVICLDDEPWPLNGDGSIARLAFDRDALARTAPELENDPERMSYIYFTSGSTGVPKAIAGRLKAIDHFIRWEINRLNLGEGVRVSQLLPLSFDGSLRDIFVPLCAGGTICIPESREEILDARRLSEWLERERVNLVHCVPSLFRTLVNEKAEGERFSELQYILMSGEALLPVDVSKWVSLYGERTQLINLYGPTETTLTKFCYFVQGSDKQRQSIPIGKPIEGVKAFLLDAKGRACPPGMVGEIYIRTPYRTHGYYNQPELTAEVFIQNPFSSDPTDIVYRTGDLARVLDDGNFEYLGRRDQQVKVRGMRVELSEIENLLRAHQSVRDVTVIDREDASGYNYLCAYVVLSEDGDSGALYEYLAAELPDYMMPSAFVEMEELPRTMSGKVDRKGLPVPGQGRSGMEEEYESPRTPVEEVLAESWAELLGVERVGINDNFFRLGGHSLLATQALTRVREVFNVELPLGQLFQYPTVARLAQSVEKQLHDGQSSPVQPIRIFSRDETLPLSFGQQRLWFLDQLEPGNPAYLMPAALRLDGKLKVSTLEQAFSEIVRRHESLRTNFALVDGQPVQIIAPAQPVTLSITDLSQLATDEREAEARRLAGAEAQRPFDLSAGPLLRVSLLKLAEDEHILLFTMHHIISDGWSIGVLVKEVTTLYEAFSAGQSSSLPELPIQYADFAHWQREWLQGEVLDAQLSYWREQLADAPVLQLPTDRPRPAVQSYRGAHHSVRLDAALTDELKRISRQEGVTLFMLLLAAFQTLLSRYSGQEDIVVGSPIANRTRAEVEGLIGFFVNTLVLRTRLEGRPSFREVLGRVREAALGAYAHQDVPFEMLVEELEPERDMSRTPLFQVMFVLQNAPQESVMLSDLSISGVAVEAGTA
ncbi:MAG TPA: amino acid adenylation domain-containing protein, partial [Pyrinomonadaceae bacterium]